MYQKYPFGGKTVKKKKQREKKKKNTTDVNIMLKYNNLKTFWFHSWIVPHHQAKRILCRTKVQYIDNNHLFLLNGRYSRLIKQEPVIVFPFQLPPKRIKSLKLLRIFRRESRLHFMVAAWSHTHTIVLLVVPENRIITNAKLCCWLKFNGVQRHNLLFFTSLIYFKGYNVNNIKCVYITTMTLVLNINNLTITTIILLQSSATPNAHNSQTHC